MAADCSLRSRNSASLRRQLSASEAGPPPDQILDPHLDLIIPPKNIHQISNFDSTAFPSGTQKPGYTDCSDTNNCSNS